MDLELILMEKGDYGYAKSMLIKQGLKFGLCLLLVVGFYIAGWIIFGTRVNILSIGTVCSVIPGVIFAVNIIMRLGGLPVKKEVYARFEEASKGHVTVCDMIVTAEEVNYPLQLGIITSHGIICYTSSKKMDIKKAERALSGLSKSVGIHNKVTVCSDFEYFLRRVKNAKRPDETERQAIMDKRKEFLMYSM